MQNFSPFRKRVWAYYKKHRRKLSWRNTRDPYRILVSEIMLQQTQVDRVIPKYRSFLKKFPNFKSLAKAQTRDVLREWQGLGYNRRALHLRRAALIVVEKHKGVLPRSYEDLMALPGVGPYTAKALRTFIWNEREIFIETNIRSVYLFSFFNKTKINKKVSDKKILPLIEKTLDTKNPRKWYYALMDYGSFLKRTHPNPSRKSAHHVKQSKFKGSRRELRGAILRMFYKQKALTVEGIVRETLRLTQGKQKRKKKEIRNVLSDLIKEGFIKTSRGKYRLV